MPFFASPPSVLRGLKDLATSATHVPKTTGATLGINRLTCANYLGCTANVHGPPDRRKSFGASCRAVNNRAWPLAKE